MSKSKSETELSDASLVAAVLSGELDEYAMLMSRYEASLLRYVVYLVHDHSLAHDIVQDTFIRAYEHLASFRPDSAFSPWIYRIAL